VQQLITVATVVESASNLLTKKIEWSRLASYLEQSTRYIYYDQKNAAGEYKYFTPQNFSAELAATYRASLDRIFNLYSETRAWRDGPCPEEKSRADRQDRTSCVARRDTRAGLRRCAAGFARATESTVGIVCSSQAMEGMVRRLLADPLQESNEPAVFCSANRAR